MARDAKKAHAPVGAGLNERLKRAAFAEDPVDLILRAYVVNLPEIEVVGP